MARITVEDCLRKISNHFQLVLVASHRARLLQAGGEPRVENDNHKSTVLALREIAAGKVDESILNEPLVEPSTAADIGKGLVGLLADDINMQPGMIATSGIEGMKSGAPATEEGEVPAAVVPEGAEGASSKTTAEEALKTLFSDKEETLTNQAEETSADQTEETAGEAETVDEAGALLADSILSEEEDAFTQETVSLENLQSKEAVPQPDSGSDEITAQTETAEAMENIADLGLDTIPQDKEENT